MKQDLRSIRFYTFLKFDIDILLTVKAAASRTLSN